MAEEKPKNNAQKTCELCNEKSSKYCCPRCEVLYCSLDCYKSEKHSECSEGFYKDCISEELASYQPDDESKLKMMEILKKMQAEGGDTDLTGEAEDDDSDDEEGLDLHERIKNLNLNDADAIWDALTEDEKNEFEAMINHGDVGSVLPLWEPWWMYRKEKRLVEEVSEKDKEALKLKQCPVLKKVPEINTLTTVQPSKAIRYNITNVLASYAFTMRYFNGEVDATEWVMSFLNICTNLDTNTNFDDPALAVESVAQKCLQSELIETDTESLAIMKYDTFLIMQGPSEENKKYYCKASLSHIHRIFAHACAHAKASRKDNTESSSSKDKAFSKKFPEHTAKDLPAIDVSKVKKCLKKLEYYLSYVESCSMDFDE